MSLQVRAFGSRHQTINILISKQPGQQMSISARLPSRRPINPCVPFPCCRQSKRAPLHDDQTCVWFGPCWLPTWPTQGSPPPASRRVAGDPQEARRDSRYAVVVAGWHCNLLCSCPPAQPMNPGKQAGEGKAKSSRNCCGPHHHRLTGPGCCACALPEDFKPSTNQSDVLYWTCTRLCPPIRMFLSAFAPWLGSLYIYLCIYNMYIV